MAENSKRNQYLLLLLVAVIWGVVIYRFWSFTKPEPDSLQPIKVAKKAENAEKTKEAYVFQLNYADPFLKNAAPKVEEQKVQPNPFFFTPLPDLVYLGLVTSGNQKVGVLKINGRSFMVREGDDHDNIRVKMLKDSQVQVRVTLNQLDTIVVVLKNKPN